MKSPVQQTRSLIFFLCAGIAVSLAQGALLPDAASHDPNALVARGMAGCPDKSPAIEKQQVDCANVRPTFQGTVAPVSIRSTAPPSAHAEFVSFNTSHRPQAALYRAHFGRAPPSSLSL
jgi:hypothetical protein